VLAPNSLESSSGTEVIWEIEVNSSATVTAFDVDDEEEENGVFCRAGVLIPTTESAIEDVERLPGIAGGCIKKLSRNMGDVAALTDRIAALNGVGMFNDARVDA
jgi:hypothetical protein